jgi:hypothetical protein
MRAPLLRNARRAAKNALRIPAARGRRARRDDGRNCIGVAPLKRLVPGGRAPSPIWPFGWACPPHPHPAHRPRPSAKGRGLPFRGHRYADRSNLRTSRYASINVARSLESKTGLEGRTDHALQLGHGERHARAAARLFHHRQRVAPERHWRCSARLHPREACIYASRRAQ